MRKGNAFLARNVNGIDWLVSSLNSKHDNCSDNLSDLQDVTHVNPILSFERDIQLYVGSDGKIC